MAVTNDNIRPPNTIQNRRNKHTFSTHAYTFDLVPLVFEKTSFAGHISESSGKYIKISKRRKEESVRQNYAEEINKEAHLRAKPRQNTTVEEV